MTDGRSMTPGDERRAGERIVLPVFLTGDRCSIEQAEARRGCRLRVPALPRRGQDGGLVEDDGAPVLPGVFYSRVAGVSFHDDVLQLPHFGAGNHVEIRHEPGQSVRTATRTRSSGRHNQFGYLPIAIAGVLAPSGTRAGRGPHPDGMVDQRRAERNLRAGFHARRAVSDDLRPALLPAGSRGDPDGQGPRGRDRHELRGLGVRDLDDKERCPLWWPGPRSRRWRTGEAGRQRALGPRPPVRCPAPGGVQRGRVGALGAAGEGTDGEGRRGDGGEGALANRMAPS